MHAVRAVENRSPSSDPTAVPSSKAIEEPGSRAAAQVAHRRTPAGEIGRNFPPESRGPWLRSALESLIMHCSIRTGIARPHCL